MKTYCSEMSRIEMTSSQKAQTLDALRKARDEEMRKENRSAECRLNRHHSQTTMPSQRKHSRASLVFGAGLAAAALAFAFALAPIRTPSPAPFSDPVATVPEDGTPSSEMPVLQKLPLYQSPMDGTGGLGATGQFVRTHNDFDFYALPENLPVYRFDEPANLRRPNELNEQAQFERMETFMKQLGMDPALIVRQDLMEGQIDSVYEAYSDYGRLHLPDADHGAIFCGGSLPFFANTEEEAIIAAAELIKTYPQLFDFKDAQIAIEPSREAIDRNWIVSIWENHDDPVDNEMERIMHSVRVWADNTGVQSISYPLDTFKQEAEYPCRSLDDALNQIAQNDRWQTPQKEQTWLVYKYDAKGEWLMPYYHVYATEKDTGFVYAIDIPAITDDYALEPGTERIDYES